MKGQSMTSFIKGLKPILDLVETVPQTSCQTRATKQAQRPCHKRLTKQRATPSPTIEDLDLGEYELYPCDCSPQGLRSLERAYLRSPSRSSLKAKERRLDYIRRALDALEPISTCKRCSEKEYVRTFLYRLCRTILRRCRAFYQLLVRTTKGKNQQPLLRGDHQRCAPAFDEDAWEIIKGHAYKLAIDTAELRFKSGHS